MQKVCAQVGHLHRRVALNDEEFSAWIGLRTAAGMSGSRVGASGRKCPRRRFMAASPAVPETSCAGLGSIGKARTRCLVGNERRRVAAEDATAPVAFAREDGESRERGEACRRPPGCRTRLGRARRRQSTGAGAACRRQGAGHCPPRQSAWPAADRFRRPGAGVPCWPSSVP